jgi:uncharacterized membrane protein YdcZ (DUF606 family)
MTQVLYVLMAMGVGVGSAVQVGFVGQMGRMRGPTEAAWINILGTFGVMAIVFGIQTLRSDPPNLPSPFNTVIPFAMIAVIATAALAVSVRGLEPYLAIAGLFGFLYLFGAGYIAPKVGIALFVGSVTAGTLIASVGLDHVGAFGGVVHRISVVRIVGLVALLAGVVLIRSGR